MAGWRDRFPELDFAGDRAILFPSGAPLLQMPVRECIAGALTYHLDRRRCPASANG